VIPILDWRLLPISNNIDLTSAYNGALEPRLVMTSVVIAILASFAALSLAPRITAAGTRRARWAWASAGALSMGGGIWAMHFIGMLAFSLPCGIAYDPSGTILSMVPGVLASGIALNVIAETRRPRFSHLVGAALLMGAGIGAMHYSGMAAIESAATLVYDPTLVLVSVLVAVALAFVSLAIRFWLDRGGETHIVATFAAASVMGCAIAGMHYTAMEAAIFVPLSDTASSTMALPPTLLAFLITIFAALIAIGTLVAAFAGRQSELAGDLRQEVGRRKELEYEARSGSARLKAIFDAVVDAIVTIDIEGRIQQWSSSAQRIFGYSAEEIEGQQLTTLIAEPDRAQLHNIAAFLKLHDPKAHGQGRELTAIRRNGGDFPIELSVSEVRIGEEIFFTGILRDITERKRAENELVRARQEAEAANEAKSQFLATMSHEIRTPLNGVLGMANLLASTPLNDRQRRLVENVMRSGQALLALINDILDFSKIEAGRLELSAVEFDPRELISELADLFGERCSRKGLEFVYYVAEEVPARLRGDPIRLRQILINLVGNAVKFTERGEILVELAVSQSSADQVTLNFVVQDTGIGIAAKQHERIFESFHQVDGSMSRARGGSGLGLAISKQLAELMDGKIGVESEPGRGSRFSFTARLGRVASTGELPRRVARSLSALLVDSNAASANVTALNFTAWGVDTKIAGTIGEAEALWNDAAGGKHPFDVAIVDVKGLGHPAVDLANRIRSDGRGRPTEVIFLVGMDGSVSDATLAAVGVYAALPKPADPAEMLACLVTLASGTHERGEAPVFVRRNALVKRPQFDARILVAEDNAVNQEVAMGMLEALGCRFVTANNGRAAVQLFAEEEFDLVLMDCEMPQMDGFEAAKRIREFENLTRKERTPIIALTAHALAEVREKCLGAGMDDFLVKPFEERRLHETMRRWIGKLECKSSSMKAEAAQTETTAGPGGLGGGAIDAAAIAGIRAMDIKGTGELLKRVVSQFNDTAPALAAAIQEKFGAGDLDAVWRAAHSLKSSAAATGARQVAGRCAEIETLARNGDDIRVKPLLQGLESELDAAMRGLKELV
jgi:PAS domain S-box-containing protein